MSRALYSTTTLSPFNHTIDSIDQMDPLLRRVDARVGVSGLGGTMMIVCLLDGVVEAEELVDSMGLIQEQLMSLSSSSFTSPASASTCTC
ncbi:hypothetical protein JCM10207_003883 [Rhodosporidiobolus poonsookiae]